MTNNNTPRIVTPDEAQWYLDRRAPMGSWDMDDLARTVATEPDRTRAAAVKALREIADLRRGPFNGVEHVPAQWIIERADAIENGANF